MFCRKCGKELKDDALFCSKCGTSVASRSNTQVNNESEDNSKTPFSIEKKLFLVFGTVAFILIMVLVLVKLWPVNFMKKYEQIGGSLLYGKWVTIYDNGKNMRIDTNPNDIDGYFSSEATEAISKLHSVLNLPTSLLELMAETRALDGRQTRTYEKVIVSWTYHPNHGLEIIYERK